MMTRPLIIRAVALMVVGLLERTTGAQAAVQREEPPAPGYYRMSLGAFAVTALSDGTVPGPVGTPVTGYLIKTVNKIVLIDTGAGTLLGPDAGKLVGNLRAAGYQPEQVDEIYITRIQPAQIGGLLVERKAVFANAIVRASREEADYWLSKSSMAAAAVEERQQFAQIAAVFKPYVLAGRLKTFDGDAELVPGVRSLPSADRMPGHKAYAAESGREKMVFWGDALPVIAAQFRDPTVAIRFDMTAAAAVARQTALLRDVAAHGYWVTGENLPFPGIGHVRADGQGFRFVPIIRDRP